jgi:hypothetical protein
MPVVSPIGPCTRVVSPNEASFWASVHRFQHQGVGLVWASRGTELVEDVGE